MTTSSVRAESEPYSFRDPDRLPLNRISEGEFVLLVDDAAVLREIDGTLLGTEVMSVQIDYLFEDEIPCALDDPPTCDLGPPLTYAECRDDRP